jgi:hypothetical protein
VGEEDLDRENLAGIIAANHSGAWPPTSTQILAIASGATSRTRAAKDVAGLKISAHLLNQLFLENHC